MTAFGCLAAIGTLLSLAPALAQTTPKPDSHPVQSIEKKLEIEKAREAELQKKMKGLKSSLKETKDTLINLGSEIRQNEQDLTTLERRIETLQQEQMQIESRLSKDKTALSSLVLALQRIERVPPEAVLARPGAPLDTAQSAMLLQGILPGLYDRTESLRNDLTRQKTVIAELKSKKETALSISKDLQSRKTKMNGLLKKRERLYAGTAKDQKQQSDAVRKIAVKAQNLKDLVRQIEKKAEQERREAKVRQTNASKPLKNITSLPRSGKAQLPVSGTLRIAYGQKDDIGAKSLGITIDTRSGALVVAPMGGVIQYAGPFRNYGNMIIIEHQKGYHSLVAGLTKIDTVVGQSVDAGEPVGRMERSQSKPSLYYELRYKGQPVNPSRKFAQLG